jgi:hypothetical protein
MSPDLIASALLAAGLLALALGAWHDRRGRG